MCLSGADQDGNGLTNANLLSEADRVRVSVSPYLPLQPQLSVPSDVVTINLSFENDFRIQIRFSMAESDDADDKEASETKFPELSEFISWATPELRSVIGAHLV